MATSQLPVTALMIIAEKRKVRIEETRALIERLQDEIESLDLVKMMWHLPDHATVAHVRQANQIRLSRLHAAQAKLYAARDLLDNLIASNRYPIMA